MTAPLAGCAVAIGLAALVFAWGTDGFAAYTSEGARRLRVLNAPRPVPAAQLEDHNGRAVRLDELRGRYVAVEFVYTRCDSLCRSLGATFRHIADDARRRGVDEALTLVTISFDPDHDDRAALARYARSFGADGTRWFLARPVDRSALAALLAAFGVVVIPDGIGGFEHNAAIHLVDPRGKLVRIDDLGEAARFVERLRPLLG